MTNYELKRSMKSLHYEIPRCVRNDRMNKKKSEEESGGFAAAFLPSLPKANVIPNAVRNLFNDGP